MAFPGPHATIIYNEEGEPMGWDYPPLSDEILDPPYDEMDSRHDRMERMFDAAVEIMIEREGEDTDELFVWWRQRQDIENVEDAYWAWRKEKDGVPPDPHPGY